MPFDEARERERFERWISAPPYEISVDRFGEYNDTWPGQYVKIDAQRSWEAWCQALKGEKS